jgi:hypothetical protein
MAIYKKSSSGVQGAWVKGKELVSGVRAKLVSETEPGPSNYKNADGTPKIQNIAKIRFEGGTESLNINLNRTNRDGLIDAFGEDSKNWIGKYLTVKTEETRIAGKLQIAVYLLPEGYILQNDEEGYAHIVNPNKEPTSSAPQEELEPQEDIMDSIPF